MMDIALVAAGVDQVHMRELAALYAGDARLGDVRGAEAAIEMLTKSSRLQDQVEYYVPAPVQGTPNSFQLQYQVTRQELQQLTELKARQTPFPQQSLLLQNNSPLGQ